jgi:hypothetical protein
MGILRTFFERDAELSLAGRDRIANGKENLRSHLFLRWVMSYPVSNRREPPNALGAVKV